MGFSNFKTLTRLVFVSLGAMVLLAACGQGIKIKELKTQAQPIPGSNYRVTFESLRVSSLNGHSAEGTIKFVLTDVRTGTSRTVSEFVRGVKDQETIDYIKSQTDEPTMTTAARCASMTCDRFELAILFVVKNGTQIVNTMALGISQEIVQNRTLTKHHFQDFGGGQVNFEQIITAANASEAK